MAKKREWSRQFTPRGQKTVNLNVSGIPPTLRARFSAKCRRVGKSQRNLLLGWIRNWTEGRRPDEDRELVGADDALLDKYNASA
jgi:hypothetical protein